MILIPSELECFLYFPRFQTELEVNPQSNLIHDFRNKAEKGFDNACWKAYKSAVLRRTLGVSEGTSELEASSQAHSYLTLSVEDWLTTRHRELYKAVAAYLISVNQVALWIPEDIQAGEELVSFTGDHDNSRIASTAFDSGFAQPTVLHGACCGEPCCYS
jgi:hypothetical protein